VSKKAGGKKKKQQQSEDGIVRIATNKKVRHDFDISKRYEAGIVLRGTEVKSLRSGDVQWADAHARLTDTDEIVLIGLYIAEYANAGTFNHRPTASRKLLLNRREINQIRGLLQQKGLTLVPESLYFKKGWAKCTLAVGKGRDKGDKRQTLKDKATKRDIQREVARRTR
jgi:SsrA-binding protein